MTLDEAAKRLTEWLAEGGTHDIVILDGGCVRRPYGWVMEFNSRAYVVNRDFSAMIIGMGPVVIFDDGREPEPLGSRYPPDEAIARFERAHGL
jgi:Immunity protein 35